MEHNWISVLPPLLAIGLAIYTREVVLSLFVGVLSGYLILEGFSLKALIATFEAIVKALANEDHAYVISFSVLLGGMVGIISASGGSLGLVSSLAKFATNPKRFQLSTWLMGLIVFFDDYANTILVGSSMRPLSDKLRVSREKLAYIVDSTAAPVASIVPLSTWIGFELGLIATSLEKSGVDKDAYFVFIATIPYRFYPILALILVLWVAVRGKDLYPMSRAEIRARKEGKVLDDNALPLAEYESSELSFDGNAVPKAITAILPISVVITVTILGIYYTGGGFQGTKPLRDVLADSNSYKALLWGSFCGVIAALFMSRYVGYTLASSVKFMIAGFKTMVIATVVLLLAWSIGDVCEQIGTANYLISVMKGFLAPIAIPAVIFILSALVSFSTGSSWATMAIIFPLGVPLAIEVVGSSDSPVVLATISSILAGSVWGDHCSPISDTTILSSMASGCDHIAHVRTQLPYAFLAALTSIVSLFVVSLVGYVWIVMIAGVIFSLIIFELLARKVEG